MKTVTDGGGRTLRIASDEMTMAEIVQQFTWPTEKGYYEPRDFVRLRHLHPGLMTFRQWLRQTGWKGEHRPVQVQAATDVE